MTGLSLETRLFSIRRPFRVFLLFGGRKVNGEDCQVAVANERIKETKAERITKEGIA